MTLETAVDGPSHLNDERRQAFFGTGIVFVGRIAGRMAFFGTNVLVARAFGPEDFGLYAIGWSVLTIFGLVAPLGLMQAVIRFAEPRRQAGSWPAFATHVLLLATLSSTLLAALMALAAPRLAEQLFKAPEVYGILLVLAPALVFRTLLTVLLAICRTEGNIGAAVRIGEVGEPVLTFLLVCAAVLAGQGVVLSAAMYTVSLAVMVPLALQAVRKGPAGLSWPAGIRGYGLREVLVYGFIVMLTHSATVLSLTVDRLMLGIFASPLDVGHYQAASQLSLATVVLLSSAAAVFEINVARFGAQARVAELKTLSHDVNRWTAHVLVPLCVLFLLVPGLILSTAYGSSYLDSGPILAVLTIGQFAIILLGQSSTLMTMLGAERAWSRIIVGAVTANVIGNLLLVPHLGAIGAAIATTVATLGQVPLAVALVRRKFGFWPLTRATAVQICVAGLAAGLAIAIAVPLVTGIPPLLGILMLTALSYGAYALTCCIIGIHSHDREILGEVRRRYQMLRRHNSS